MSSSRASRSRSRPLRSEGAIGSDVPDHLPPACELTVSARPEGIEAIHDLVQSLWLQGPTISATDRMRFETAVIEVASNIVKHATAGAPGPEEVTIELMLMAEPDRVTARFCDDGSAAEVDLALTQMPDTTAEFGRGIALAQVLVDDLTYERSVCSNIWTLTCLRAGTPGAER